VSIDDERLAALLARPHLPPGFERWEVVLAAGSERPTSSAEWAGALILVESGVVEAVCLAGGHETFVEGDLVALGWLPVTRLRNPSAASTRIVAVRRRGPLPTEAGIHVRPRRAEGLP
jgi:hypothetical protein